MDKNQRNIYYLNEFVDNDILNQLKRTNDTLKSDLNVKDNFDVHQGQIVEYLYFNYKKNKFSKTIALALSNSSKNENNLIICPLIPLLSNEDAKQGINVGKILRLSTEHDFVAAILEIKNVSKSFIKQNKELNDNWLGSFYVPKIIETYRNFLQSIVRKNQKCCKEFYC